MAGQQSPILDVDNETHEDYLAKFKTTLMNHLHTTIDKNLQNDPDCVKGRKKTVQVDL